MIKGFIIGLAKVLPGISGSMIAISLGVYEKCIYILCNLKKEFLKNIKFIFYLSIGFIIALIFGSKIVKYFINNYYIETIYLFMGLILGSTKDIYNKVKLSIKNILYMLIGLVILISINFINLDVNYDSYLLLGIIDSISSIIPGISGTALMILLGNYDLMLELLSNPITINSIYFLIGVLIGGISIIKLVNYMLTKHKEVLYSLVIGFSISSLINLYLNIMNIKISLVSGIICVILFIIGILISNKINKKD